MKTCRRRAAAASRKNTKNTKTTKTAERRKTYRQARRTRRTKTLQKGGGHLHTEVRSSTTDKGVEYKKDLQLLKGDPLLELAPADLKTRVKSYFKNQGVMTLQKVEAYAGNDTGKTIPYIRVKVQTSLGEEQKTIEALEKMTSDDLSCTTYTQNPFYDKDHYSLTFDIEKFEEDKFTEKIKKAFTEKLLEKSLVSIALSEKKCWPKFYIRVEVFNMHPNDDIEGVIKKLKQFSREDIFEKDDEGARFTADGNLRIDIPIDDTPASDITEAGIKNFLMLPEETKINLYFYKNKTTIVIDMEFKEPFVDKFNKYKESVKHKYEELPAPPAIFSTLGATKSSSSAEKDPYADPPTRQETHEYAIATGKESAEQNPYVAFDPYVSPAKEAV